MSQQLAALGSGVLFAVGLALGGMTRPSKVLAFLDLAGAWDPSLLCVMVGAIAVYATAYWSSRRMQKPISRDAFTRPEATRIDARLVSGAAIFGIGWGLAGYCPGPAFASLGAGMAQALLFVPAMLTGLWLTRSVLRRIGA